MGLSIRNLETLGSELCGVDLSKPLSEHDRLAIGEALDRHLVIVARDQHLSDPQLLAFSANFGELDPPGPNPYGEPFNKEFPEINVISNVVENGRPIGNLGAGEAVWHADMTYIEVPPKAAVLHALEIPPGGGGNTYFADMYAAYEAMPRELRHAVEGKRLVHDASRNSAGLLRKGYKEVRDVRETVGATHPIVRTDPRTRRRSLFLGRRPNSYIAGLDVAESEALLDAVWAHATQVRFTMCHEWRVGDFLMWNNPAVLHRRDSFDENARRVMHRTQIKGAERIA
ncbi:MAG: taurine dioxygenase [Alphaproteobacteria bacterium]|jgi:taurine dioxygenase|nr:taurine dioxygenase [Alphaproteobacteria bacterium]